MKSWRRDIHLRNEYRDTSSFYDVVVYRLGKNYRAMFLLLRLEYNRTGNGVKEFAIYI